MSDPNQESRDAAKARSGRNIAIALALVAFVILVFVISMAKMSAHVVPHV